MYIFFGESSKFPKSKTLKIQITILKILTTLILHGRLSLDQLKKKSEKLFEICLIQYFEAAFPMNVASKY